MSTALRPIIDRFLAAVEARDVEGALALLADDAVVIDPHYPTPRMEGKAAVADGLCWVYGVMASMRFTVMTYAETDDGHTTLLEVTADHVLKSGMAIHTPQVFVVEINDNLITRFQAYTPFGPGGIAGAFLALTRLGRLVGLMGGKAGIK